ncbi:hypothetical protein [Streptomyces sp. NPDC051567]|uniref:hypothetical protein n=1 Tax=Streptomyces sp. NPDC051567 TaxID=3365660 RepID=UPI00378B352A
MGIESDHLVYEYLSRVGDLAHRRQLASADRMRLVAGLRDEIDRRRAKYEPETPAAVRRILERIGTPEEVLDTLGSLSAPDRPPGPAPGAAPGSGSGSVAQAPPPGPVPSVPPVPVVPVQRGTGLLRRKPVVPPPRPADTAPAPPHLAGLDELGPGDGAEPDWWRVAPGAYGSGPQVEGFAGGIEIPDLFKKGPEDEDEDEPGPKSPPGRPARAKALVRGVRERLRAKPAAAPPGAEKAEKEGKQEAPAARPRPNVFLLLAAAVLVAGVATGSWLLLVVGWLLPYGSRVLGPVERKWTVLGPPGAVLAGAALWLWGRMDGRWGEALTSDQLGAALQGMGPWLARTAGVASALYLVWRARRR